MKADAKPTFTDVAKLIAKGPPPEWLVDGLEHFSGFVGGDPAFSKEKKNPSKEKKRAKQIIARMHDATDHLIKFLPLFGQLELGIRCPPDVREALVVLPKIKKRLAYAMDVPTRGGGQDPNVRRKFCAAVVIEAWRIVHGKPEPESPKLWTACNEYWRACGREYRGGDVDTWRSDCRAAIADNHGLIRQVLSTLKTGRN